LGRSRGGLTTKIHLLCDSLGLPLKFIVAAGQSSDFTYAVPLLEGEKASYVIADKGYDSQEIVNFIEEQLNATPVIPPKSNRKLQRQYDKIIYKERNVIERLFGRLKQFRKLATRFEKIKRNFESLLSVACAWIWLN